MGFPVASAAPRDKQKWCGQKTATGFEKLGAFFVVFQPCAGLLGEFQICQGCQGEHVS